MSTNTNTSSSAVVSSLVANLATCGIFVTSFIILRLKFKRIYSPVASLDIVPEEKRPRELPKGPFSWIFILLTRKDTKVIQYTGLDGYFFLRYIFIVGLIFIAGIFWYTVLLPINATDGHGTGFDRLSIANITHHNRYYAHVFIGWVFYGSIVFIIHRELFYYNSLRLAALSSPKYAHKLSSRTVLFQSVPDTLLDEKQFFKLFNGVKRVYVARNLRKLSGKIRNRDALINRLEAAETKLLVTAYKNKLKAAKKGNIIDSDNIEDYVPETKRPRFKPQGGLFATKVDTINYCLEHIPKIEKEVRKLQKIYRTAKPKNSLFVEFENQYLAQLAIQSTVHHNPLRVIPVATGMEIDDVIWSNTRIFWWERTVREAIAVAAIVAVIILWAIPVAFVGVISNITYLTNKLPWLRWVYNLPHKLLGIITGLLPTILLSILLAMLPIFLRGMATVSGAATVQKVEMYTQNAYYGFLVINSFVVITLASSATSVVTQIIDEPTSALNLLANNLPKASNFFISYVILQGLTITGSGLFQVVGLFLYYILGALLDKTLTKKWARYTGLGTMAYGTTFPVYTNLATIILAYSIISPLILAFGAFAFVLVFIAFSYNMTYVFVEGSDNRGMHYPRALFQTFTGIYLGQICMLGIFVVGKGWGPIILQAIGLGFTVFSHISLSKSFDGLLKVVSLDVMRPLDGTSVTPSFDGTTDYKRKVLDRKIKHENEVKHESTSDDIEMNLQKPIHSLVPLLADRDFKTLESNNILMRFFRPDVFLNFRHAAKILPDTYNTAPPPVDDKNAYNNPIISARPRTIWIPHDPMGLSQKEIDNAKGVIHMSDTNSKFTSKGTIKFTGPPPP